MLPIIALETTNKKEIETLVDKIIAVKAADPQADTTRLERQVDNLVYRLYSLTYEEVKVIEPEFPLGKAAYEGIEVQRRINK
jgi:hypothetical protein